MANLTGPSSLFEGDTNDVHTSAQHIVGLRAFDNASNEYVYLQGTASVAATLWVRYDLNVTNSQTSLATANDVGPLAIAGTAVLAGQYGWFQVYGKASAANLGGVAANKALYLTGTAGYVDDADVAGDAIVGAASLAANSGSATVVYLTHPFVHDIAID